MSLVLIDLPDGDGAGAVKYGRVCLFVVWLCLDSFLGAWLRAGVGQGLVEFELSQ